MNISRLPSYPGDRASPSGRRAAPDLSDCLDALDRLFDRVSSLAEVSAVLSAARDALRGTAHYDVLDRAVGAMHPIVLSGASAEVQWERALGATDDVRLYLAKNWSYEMGKRPG